MDGGKQMPGRLNFDDLQSVGLSRRKAEYVIELARAETDGRLNLKQLNKQPSEKFSANCSNSEALAAGQFQITDYSVCQILTLGQEMISH